MLPCRWRAAMPCVATSCSPTRPTLVASRRAAAALAPAMVALYLSAVALALPVMIFPSAPRPPVTIAPIYPLRSRTYGTGPDLGLGALHPPAETQPIPAYEPPHCTL